MHAGTGSRGHGVCRQGSMRGPGRGAGSRGLPCLSRGLALLLARGDSWIARGSPALRLFVTLFSMMLSRACELPPRQTSLSMAAKRGGASARTLVWRYPEHVSCWRWHT